MQHYPSWRYHALKAAVIVKDESEDEALGEGWEHTPAAFKDRSSSEASKPKAKSAQSTGKQPEKDLKEGSKA